MANYQDRNRRRYQDYEENRQPRQSRYYSDYEGNPFSDEDEYGDAQGSDYGRPYSSNTGSQRQRQMGSDYDTNYRNQGFSSSGQSNRGQYDRSRNRDEYQGEYGYNMPQPGSEYSTDYDEGMGQGQYGQSQYGQGQYGRNMGQGQYNRNMGQGQYGRRMDQYSSDYDSQRGSESQSSHRGKGFKGWKRSDDSIYDEIGRILEMHHDIDPSEVEVKVRNGEVTLEGTVPDRMTKRRLEDALDMISGVTDVQNRVRIQNSSSKGQQNGERQQQSQSSETSQTGQKSQKMTSPTSRSSES